jgi:curved DNA-binding protein
MFGGADFSDFFENLFGSGRGFNGGRSHPRHPRDEEHPIQLTLDEAFHGTTRVLQWDDGRRVEARIPRGVDTGSRVRLSGQGSYQGDLYLIVDVLPHARFRREGDDLHLTTPVPLYTLILGGVMDVAGIDRSVLLTIPPETNNGRVFRLRNMGMPVLKQPDQRGNLYVTVQAELPRNLSEKERQLFEQLRDMRFPADQHQQRAS